MPNKKPAPFLPQAAVSPTGMADSTPAPRPRRINPWKMFIGSLVPNWLQRRPEVSQGAKLAYGRLAQFAGEDGKCFPKQITLGAELGVSERMANEYIRKLVKFGLIEKLQCGLRQSNRYFFLDHPWIHDSQPKTPTSSVLNQKNASGLERQEASAPISKENQCERESTKRTHTAIGSLSCNLPSNEQEALEAAIPDDIPADFARHEYNKLAGVGWVNGVGNPIKSWPHYLKKRWADEQSQQTARRTNGVGGRKRGSRHPIQFSAAAYQQPVKNF